MQILVSDQSQVIKRSRGQIRKRNHERSCGADNGQNREQHREWVRDRDREQGCAVATAGWSRVHERAMKCARNLKSAYRELLSALIEVERDKIFYQLEVTSLYSYCVEILDLPKSTAYDFIDVIRTSKDVPELAEAVFAGRTTISKARRICSVMTPKNQKEWIDLVCECPHKTVQRAVAMANPRSAHPETLNYISGDVLEIKFAVSEEWSELLRDVKDLMSQKRKRAVSTEEALFILMAEYKRKRDPVARAERATRTTKHARQKDRAPRKSRIDHQATAAGAGVEMQAELQAESKEEPKTESQSEPHATRSRYRTMSVEHAVNLRDGHRCRYVDRNGVRCASRRWLHKHHVVEFAKGGAHVPENLETLCWAHHRIRHRTSDRD